MNNDKLTKILMWMFFAVGVMALTVGKFIMGGVLLAVGLAMWMTIGGGSFNERNLYDKMVDPSVKYNAAEVYDLLKEMDSPLGKCWMGRVNGIEGQSVIFGPGIFKDYVAIGQGKKGLIIKNSTELTHITFPEAEAWRQDQVLDTTSVEVNPKSYSDFAGHKVVSAAFTEDLLELLEGLARGEATVPESMDEFHLYYCNSRDCMYRDMQDVEYGSVIVTRDPMLVTINDPFGEEMATVRENGKSERDGYTVTASGQKYGTIYRDSKAKSDAFYMDTEDGQVRIVGFRAVRKGNLSCNYRVFIDDREIGVIAGTAKLRFADDELTENSIVCCYDDDDLMLCMVMQEFIMAKNKWLK